MRSSMLIRTVSMRTSTDPQTRTKIGETGGANVIFITKDGKLVTPKSTASFRLSHAVLSCRLQRDYLGMETEEREVYLDEVKDFAECGLCGTAAVISPVGKIVDHGKEICFPAGMEKMGPVTQKLYETLTGIGWVTSKLRRAGST